MGIQEIVERRHRQMLVFLMSAMVGIMMVTMGMTIAEHHEPTIPEPHYQGVAEIQPAAPDPPVTGQLVQMRIRTWPGDVMTMRKTIDADVAHQGGYQVGQPDEHGATTYKVNYQYLNRILPLLETSEETPVSSAYRDWARNTALQGPGKSPEKGAATTLRVRVTREGLLGFMSEDHPRRHRAIVAQALWAGSILAGTGAMIWLLVAEIRYASRQQSEQQPRTTE